MWVKLLMDALKANAAPAGDDSGGVVGVMRSLTAIRHTVDSQAGLYVQLVQLELAQEQRRLMRMLVLLSVAFVSFGGLMLFSGVLILALIWETEYRNWVLGALVLGYGLILLVAIAKLRALKTEFGRPFASVREELKADLAIIKSQL